MRVAVVFARIRLVPEHVARAIEKMRLLASGGKSELLALHSSCQQTKDERGASLHKKTRRLLFTLLHSLLFSQDADLCFSFLSSQRLSFFNNVVRHRFPSKSEKRRSARRVERGRSNLLVELLEDTPAHPHFALPACPFVVRCACFSRSSLR